MFSEAVNLVTETVDGVLGILRFLQTRHLKEGVTNDLELYLENHPG